MTPKRKPKWTVSTEKTGDSGFECPTVLNSLGQVIAYCMSKTYARRIAAALEAEHHRKTERRQLKLTAAD